MTGADVLVTLLEAGAELRMVGGRLAIDAPPSVLEGPLLEAARQARCHLVLVPGEAWRAELAGWPGSLREAWAERAAMREHAGNQPRHIAEVAAFVEIRELALIEVDPSGAFVGELGAELVSLRARVAQGAPKSRKGAT